MPIREYQSKSPVKFCEYCRDGFENLERISAPPLLRCPHCGAPVARMISAPHVGGSKTGYDDRARRAGFHKFKKLGRGEYEKQY